MSAERPAGLGDYAPPIPSYAPAPEAELAMLAEQACRRAAAGAGLAAPCTRDRRSPGC